MANQLNQRVQEEAESNKKMAMMAANSGFNRILAMLGLKLGVVRIVRTPDSPAGPHNDAS